MACQAVTNGFKCEKNKLITISAVDPTMTTHVWTIDDVQESTLAQFQKTYAALGSHTVVHSGANACLDTCSESTQLEIVDAITPPSTQAEDDDHGASPMIVIAAVVFLGFLGIVMLKKK